MLGMLIGRFLRALGGNLVAAVLMLLFRRSALRWLTANPGQFLAMLLLSLATSFCFDFISEGGVDALFAQGLHSLLAGVPGTVSLPALASYLLPPFFMTVFGLWLSQRYAAWRLGFAPVVAWLGADMLIGLAQCAVQYAGQRNWLPEHATEWVTTIYTFLFLWPLAAVVTLFGRALGWRWWQDGLAAALMVAVFMSWSLLFSDQRMWQAADVTAATEEDQPSALTEESVFYAQPELLQRALADVQPGQPGRVDWYFLGVGGDDYQDVFRQEAESVKSLFDTRFGTKGRSLSLINNDDSALSTPIATRTSIARALKTIGEKMNKDEDVLFLFMTSHGAAGEFELNYDPLQLDPVTPEWLRDALDAAGIKHRVIAISACYSGSFIPALRTPDSVVITAADAHHTSFGCSDDADFTYFGRAMFDEALRHQHSLTAAFDEAKVTIRKREQEEGFEPSNPQMFIGSDMQQALPKLESTLFPPP